MTEVSDEQYFENAVRHGWALREHENAFFRALAEGMPRAEAIGSLVWPQQQPVPRPGDAGYPG